MSGSVRGGAIDQNDIIAVGKFEILQAIIENQCVGGKMFDREATSLDTILVHDNRNAIQIPCQHEGLISREFRIEQESPPIGNDLGHFLPRDDTPVAIFPFLRLFESPAFVTARKNGDLATTIAEGSGEHFRNGGLAGATNGDVANRNDLSAKMSLLFPTFAENHQAQSHETAEDDGEQAHRQPRHPGTETPSAAEDDIGRPAFQLGKGFLHSCFRGGFTVMKPHTPRKENVDEPHPVAVWCGWPTFPFP